MNQTVKQLCTKIVQECVDAHVEHLYAKGFRKFEPYIDKEYPEDGVIKDIPTRWREVELEKLARKEIQVLKKDRFYKPLNSIVLSHSQNGKTYTIRNQSGTWKFSEGRYGWYLRKA
jgi:hypothetical protein